MGSSRSMRSRHVYRHALLELKSTIKDLAAFGGPPLFAEELCVGRPNIGRRELLLERLGAILDSQWLTNNGPYVEEFEARIAAILGVSECVAVCNATLGLQILAKALDLSGEVIVPSFTFVATPNALQWLGLKPVFCDVDLQSHCLDPARVEALVTPRTSAVLGVHLWGRACDVTALEEIASRRGLQLLFDASHAFACSHQGRMIGGFGAAEVFSFHATKFVNAFEGGAVLTNNTKLAGKLRLLRNYGFSGYDQTSSEGINAKMSEPSAAMGLTSLDSIDEFVAANYRNYLHYQRQLERLPGISLLAYDEAESCNFQYIVARIDADAAEVSRDTLQAILWAERIRARRYFYPGCHRLEPYRSHFRARAYELANTEILSDEILCLPTGTSIDRGEIVRICDLIRFVVENGLEITARLTEPLRAVEG